MATLNRRFLALILCGASFLLSSQALTVYAGETLGFPKEQPAFTFELPDSMQAQYEANGNLVCTAKDGTLSLKGVFQPLPNIASDKNARMGLARLIRLMGPRVTQTDLRYPAPFDQATTSGVNTITYAATGRQNGVDYALALIVFSKNGKYYELIASGAIDAMTKCNFPHSFRETMKLTP